MEVAQEVVVGFDFHRLVMEVVLPFALILLGTLSLHLLIVRFYKRARRRLERTALNWDVAVLEALVLPLKLLIWVLAFTCSAQLSAVVFDQSAWSQFFISVRVTSIVVLVVFFLMRFIKCMEKVYTDPKFKIAAGGKKKRGLDPITVRAVCQILRVVVLVIGTLVYLQTRSINISAVLAFGGAGGLIVGLAAKDLLANFFGGLMIYLDRPFAPGDWIRSPDREIEGTVEHVGWRLTRIRTFDKRPLYVPNGLFSTISVENPSRMSNRRIKVRIGIRYQDASKMGVIVADVEQMLKEINTIDNSAFMMVRFDQFGASSLNFLIYCFTKTVDWADYMLHQQEIYLKVVEIIEAHGAQCAFPTTTLDFHGPLPVQISS